MDKKEKVDMRQCLAAMITAIDMLEGEGKNANEAADELREVIDRLTIPQYLQACADAEYDRPSAYWSLCSRQGIKGEVPELAMHAKSRKYGWEGDDAEALAHMKLFDPKDIRLLFTAGWST